jgi:hypothetical protein
MAKGDRKRSTKTEKKDDVKPKEDETKKTIYEKFPARTLSQTDANYMKEIFEMSNNVSALIRDYATKEITVAAMREAAKSIETEKEPLMIQVAKNIYKTERDYKKLAKSIREQANVLEKQLVLIEGQIAHRYEDYVSALIMHNRFIENIVKSAEIKSIYHRRGDGRTKEDEKILFEKEFDEMTDKDVEELKELNTKIQKELKEKKEQ